MTIRHRVDLSDTERRDLQALVSGGTQAVRTIKRAQILLAADAGGTDEAIVASVGVSTATVYRTRRRLVEGNLKVALTERPRPGAARKLSGAGACTTAPAQLRQPYVGRRGARTRSFIGVMCRRPVNGCGRR